MQYIMHKNQTAITCANSAIMSHPSGTWHTKWHSAGESEARNPELAAISEVIFARALSFRHPLWPGLGRPNLLAMREDCDSPKRGLQVIVVKDHFVWQLVNGSLQIRQCSRESRR